LYEGIERKDAVGARKAERPLENYFTEARKVEKVVTEFERHRKIRQTADEKSKRVRVDGKRRRVARVEGLAADATRKPIRRKINPLTIDEKVE